MIDIHQLLEKIELIPQDDTLYLVDKLPCGTGMFVCNGNILYLVPNKENCDSFGIRTDFLHLDMYQRLILLFCHLKMATTIM